MFIAPGGGLACYARHRNAAGGGRAVCIRTLIAPGGGLACYARHRNAAGGGRAVCTLIAPGGGLACYARHRNAAGGGRAGGGDPNWIAVKARVKIGR
jgi:hypothetical protein